jgi:hypothetical protein
MASHWELPIFWKVMEEFPCGNVLIDVVRFWICNVSFYDKDLAHDMHLRYHSLFKQ